MWYTLTPVWFTLNTRGVVHLKTPVWFTLNTRGVVHLKHRCGSPWTPMMPQVTARWPRGWLEVVTLRAASGHVEVALVSAWSWPVIPRSPWGQLEVSLKFLLMLFRGYVQVCLEVSLEFVFGWAGAHLEVSILQQSVHSVDFDSPVWPLFSQVHNLDRQAICFAFGSGCHGSKAQQCPAGCLGPRWKTFI